MSILQAIVLAIVEGITEFLPVSSTGHMVIATAIMKMRSDEFTKLFTVCIQFGAILSVVVLYFKRFLKSVDFYLKLFVAFIPAALAGFFAEKYIDEMLSSVMTVAVSLLIGGIILIFIDKLFKESADVEEKEISFFTALKIGLFQVIAMIPGVSRSGATIIGGMTQKLSRKQAAEFSFFLAVPTMFAASVYKIYKVCKEDSSMLTDHINLFIVGNIVAFIVALLAIKFFINFLTRHGFKLFGYYRIVMGLILIILLICGVDLSIPE